jgi:hypothetical protein
MKKLSNRDYTLHKIADFAGVILLVGLLLFMWQLYRGSIALPFLKPYIVRALNHDDTDYQVTLDGVNLELVRSVQPLRIIANNVVYQKDGAITVSAPKVALSFSLRALLRGIIAPSVIEIDQPKIFIYTKYGVKEDKSSSEVSRKKLEYYFEQAEDFWEHFNSEDNTYPESYINAIHLTKADVELLEVDLGKKWQFSDVNYSFDRGFGHLQTEINALMPFGETTASVGLSADYMYKNATAELKFYFSDLIPADLIQIMTPAEASKDFYNIRVPLHGTVSTVLNLHNLASYKDDILQNSDKLIDKIAFEFNGEKGKIHFSQDENYDYELSGLILRGEISGNLEQIKISDAKLNLDGQTAALGVEIDGLKEWLTKNILKNLKVRLTAQVESLATEKLTQFWPKYFGVQAWDWCHENLSSGTIKNGNFAFDFGYNAKNKSFEFKKLSGTAEIINGAMRYLPTMPQVTDIDGTAHFSEHNIRIDVNTAKSDDVILKQGYVDLYDLDKEDNFLKLEANAVGSITDILRLIDHDPLNYPSSIGLNPQNIKGSAEGTLGLQFELREDLDPKDVKVDVKAVLRDVVVKDVIKDSTVEAKTLDFALDNSQMNLSGVANVDGLPLTLLWEEQFNSSEYQRRYQIGFNFDNAFKSKIGLNVAALDAPFIQGSVPTKAIITVYPDGRTIVDAHGNLRDTVIDYGFLGFEKKAGVNGEISAQINVRDNQISSVPSFTLSKPEFKLNGNLTLDGKGRVTTVDITDIKGKRTNAKAKIDIAYAPKEKIKVIVTGAMYDLSDFFSRDEDEIEAAKQKRAELKSLSSAEEDEDDTWDNIPDTDISIAVDRLWTNPDISIRNFAGSAKIINKVGIHEMHVVGNFKPKKSNSKQKPFLKLDYTPRPNNEYLLAIDSNDAGSTMRFLRLYDYVRGGTLSINAKRGSDKKFVGYAKARDFNLIETNLFAKLLTLASFTGIVDMLSGDGIAFTHFDAPFEYQNSKLILKDAKAFGNVIGISGKGTYNNKYQEFDFQGLIAPAYGLNTFLGKIPLVGSLLSGKDGTVFAVNYQITGDIDDPVININPLSALSPNSVKEFWYNNFGESND